MFADPILMVMQQMHTKYRDQILLEIMTSAFFHQLKPYNNAMFLDLKFYK